MRAAGDPERDQYKRPGTYETGGSGYGQPGYGYRSALQGYLNSTPTGEVHAGRYKGPSEYSERRC